MQLQKIINNRYIRSFFVFFLSLFLSVGYAPLSDGKSTNISSHNIDNTEVSLESSIEGTTDFFQDFQENESIELPYMVADPLQPINRIIFKFNDGIYTYLLSPLAQGYSNLVPLSVRESIDHFYTNWAFPIRLVNTGLQLKFNQSVIEIERFLINTTLGIGGFFDPASKLELLSSPPAEDLGQSLGYWGIGHGFYIVLPVLGPSSARDVVGRVGDYFLDPINYIDSDVTRIALDAEKFINSSPTLMDNYKILKEVSTDPYIALRNIYFQKRKTQLKE